MLLAIDIGNTEITVGLFDGERVTARWRWTTTRARTSDEWMSTLLTTLVHAGYSGENVRSVVYGSVAPGVTDSLVEGVTHAVRAEAVAVSPASPLPITLDVDEPMTVGADRIVNTLAASELYQRDTVVVDFGTATTFDCITADCRFIGGVIAPGVRTASDELAQRAAKLPATELVSPDHVIGRRTEDCIKAGVLFGAVDATDGIIRRIRDEWPGDTAPYVVATGGFAAVMAGMAREIEHVDLDLTLLGLRIAARHLGLAW